MLPCSLWGTGDPLARMALHLNTLNMPESSLHVRVLDLTNWLEIHCIITSTPKAEITLFSKVWTSHQGFQYTPCDSSYLEEPSVSVLCCYDRAGYRAMNKDLVTTGPQHHSTNTVSAFLAVRTHGKERERKQLFTKRACIQGRKQERCGGGVRFSYYSPHLGARKRSRINLKDSVMSD